MNDKTRSVYSWMTVWALILCTLAWGFLFHSRGSKTRKSHSSASAGALPPKGALETPPSGTQRADDTGEHPSQEIAFIPSKGGFSGTVRLKPDESAVLSYAELAPGMYRAVIITPETQADGKINLKTRLLRMTEKDASREDIKDIFPDIFEIERQGALNKRRLDDFLTSTTNDNKAQVSEIPSMVTEPGQSTGIALSGSNDDGSPFNDGKALMLSIAPKPRGDSGGFDLKYDLKHLEPQPSDTPGVLMAPR
jgi:hypothetical protein